MKLNYLQLQEKDSNSEVGRIERQIRLADPNLRGPVSRVRDPNRAVSRLPGGAHLGGVDVSSPSDANRALSTLERSITRYQSQITSREKQLGIPGMEANAASIESRLPRTAGSLLVKSAVDETRRSDPNYRAIFEKWDAAKQDLDKAQQDKTLASLRLMVARAEDQRDSLRAPNLTPVAIEALNDKLDQKLKLLKDLRSQQAIVERQLQDAKAPCEMIVKAEAANCGTPLAEITLRIAPGGKTGGN
jgi:hypothetical protein